MCCLLLYCTQGLLYSLSKHLPAMNAWFLTLLSITELRTWWVFLLSKARELWMGGSRVGSESLCAKTPSSDGSLRVPEETHSKRFSHMRWKGNLHFPETEAKRNVWNTQVGRAGRRRQDMTYRCSNRDFNNSEMSLTFQVDIFDVYFYMYDSFFSILRGLYFFGAFLFRIRWVLETSSTRPLAHCDISLLFSHMVSPCAFCVSGIHLKCYIEPFLKKQNRQKNQNPVTSYVSLFLLKARNNTTTWFATFWFSSALVGAA